jgi:hypothetical protein
VFRAFGAHGHFGDELPIEVSPTESAALLPIFVGFD